MRKMTRWSPVVAAATAMATVGLAACGGTSSTAATAAAQSGSSQSAQGQASSGPSGSLTIALQPDLGYAPLEIIQQEGWLTKALPNVKVTWQALNSGSAIENGMVSGHIDVGAASSAPFLLGVTKGVGWKTLSSMLEQSLWLVCKPGIKSVKDIKPSDKIAVVAPTSIQAIVLKAAAKKFLGNADALDSNFVILSHAVALQSFKVGRIACALDAPPFQSQEVKAGGHIVTTSFDILGSSTWTSVFVIPKVYKAKEKTMNVLATQIKRAVNLLKDDPKSAAAILAKYEKGQASESAILEEIQSKGTVWSTVPHGFLRLASVMQSLGLINNAPTSMDSLVLPTLKATPGN